MERNKDVPRQESVEVILDADGVAQAIHIRADDLHRLAADEVGQLIIAADTAAAYAYLSVALAKAEAAAANEPAAALPLDGQPATGPLPLSDLTSRVLALADRYAALPEVPEPATARYGPVRLTMTDDRISACVLDPRWLARANRREIAVALQNALQAVRSERIALRGPTDRLAADAHELMSDLRSTMKAMAAPAVRRG